MLRMAIGLIAIVAPLQILIGDLHGLNTLQHQPAKVAAMEAIGRRGRGAAAIVAWPDEAARRNHFEISHSQARQPHPHPRPNGEVKGLKALPPERPAAGDPRLLRLPDDGGPRPR